jgi:hypothetical protein
MYLRSKINRKTRLFQPSLACHWVVDRPIDYPGLNDEVKPRCADYTAHELELSTGCAEYSAEYIYGGITVYALNIADNLYKFSRSCTPCMTT